MVICIFSVTLHTSSKMVVLHGQLLLTGLLVAYCSIKADGRYVLLQQQHGSRRLHQTCPIKYCLPGSCTVGAGSESSCAACQPPRVPNLAYTECVCPAGRYPTASGGCAPCTANFYCPQQQTNQGVPPGFILKRCPKNTLTKGKRATSILSCLNAPGFRLVKGSPALVMPCGRNEYSVGLDGSYTCTPCPSGYATDPLNFVGTHTSAAVCLSPPGYFINGNSVVPCPVGTFSKEYHKFTTCMSCGDILGPGITTAAAASNTSAACSVLHPGFALVNNKGSVVMDASVDLPGGLNSAKSTKPCPQSFYCPGGNVLNGDGVPQACPQGLMTPGEGARSLNECVAPPGWYLPDDRSSDMQECPSGTYKTGWNRASSCTPCGSGPWLSEPTVAIAILDQNNGKITATMQVRGGTLTCYIQPGMGVVKPASSKTAGDGSVDAPAELMQAIICPKDHIGSSVKRNGVSVAPCSPCPNFMTTAGKSRAQSYITAEGKVVPVTEGGFYDVDACVVPPGFGYYGEGAQICPKGYFNAGNNKMSCTECPVGTTTADVGATSISNCTLYNAGYGLALAGITERCPLGTYSIGNGIVNQTACLPCGNGRTTPETGATSLEACSLCAAGFGASSAEHCQPCAEGTYSPGEGRLHEDTMCITCPVRHTFTYEWKDGPDVFTPFPTGPVGAKSESDCLLEFSQTVDGAFYLDFVDGLEQTSGDLPNVQLNLRSCVDKCRAAGSCAAATWDYDGLTCKLWHPGSSTPGNTFAKNGGIAMKAFGSAFQAHSIHDSKENVPSATLNNSITTDSDSTAVGDSSTGSDFGSGAVHSQGMGTGVYSYTAGSAAAALSINSTSLFAVDGVSLLKDCLWSCSIDNFCSGVVFGAYDTVTDMIVGDVQGAVAGTKCQVIKGVSKPGDSKRTLIKAKYTALAPA